MRRPFANQIALALIAATLVIVVSPAGAHHLRSRYCSASGDICERAGEARLTIRTQERYFRVFHLCVLDPQGHEWCAPYRLRPRADGTWGRRVDWFEEWGSAGPGAYEVSWWDGDKRIGRRLGFHVR